MLESGKIDEGAALLVMLANQVEILARLERLSVQVGELSVELKGRVTELEEYNQFHPSLLYLFRFQTKETIVVIIMLFVALSVWWVSGFRQPLLELLGLPVF